MMKMSERGKELLSQWEGVELHVYNDVAGLPTIGVGHLLTRDELTSGKIQIQGNPVRYHPFTHNSQPIVVYDVL